MKTAMEWAHALYSDLDDRAGILDGHDSATRSELRTLWRDMFAACTREAVEEAIRIAGTVEWCKECLAADQIIDDLRALVVTPAASDSAQAERENVLPTPVVDVRRAANWKPPANGARCFAALGDSETCMYCEKHVSRHFGSEGMNEYRCDPKPDDEHGKDKGRATDEAKCFACAAPFTAEFICTACMHRAEDKHDELEARAESAERERNEARRQLRASEKAHNASSELAESRGANAAGLAQQLADARRERDEARNLAHHLRSAFAVLHDDGNTTAKQRTWIRTVLDGSAFIPFAAEAERDAARAERDELREAESRYMAVTGAARALYNAVYGDKDGRSDFKFGELDVLADALRDALAKVTR